MDRTHNPVAQASPNELAQAARSEVAPPPRSDITPVQTAVKRADEQAFALANGQNLMFCEDAARRIQKALSSDPNIADFHLRVAHHESLHPHDAVAFASKVR